MALLTTSLVVVGCGDDGDGADDVRGGRPAPVRGAPSASDVEAVEPYVEELLANHDRVVGEIVAEPSAATDPDGSIVEQYLALYEPDSEFAEGAVGRWAAMDQAGRSIQPYDEQHPTIRTRIDGEIVVASDDEVTVPICEERRETVYENGAPIEGAPLLEEAGSVVVVRVDGGWLLRRREAARDVVGCRTERD